MDPTDFWGNLPKALVAHHGERGRRLSGKAALAIAYALIALPWVMAAGATAALTTGLALLLGALRPVIGSELYAQLGYVLVPAVVVILLLWLAAYVVGRIVELRIDKRLTERERQLAQGWEQLKAHWREHDEAPSWHIVVNTPEEAHEQEAEIRDILLGYWQ